LTLHKFKVVDGVDPSIFFDETRLLVQKLGDVISRDGHLLLGIDGRIWRYCEGVFRADGDAFVKTRVRELLLHRVKKHYLVEVLSYVQMEYANVTDQQPEGELNLGNGLLNWRTLELRDHNPESVFTCQIPLQWDPEARCHEIDAFLQQVLPADAIDFVIEIIGYALYAGNPLRKAVLFLGPGGNGKSVLLAIIRALIGEANVSAVSLQMLVENRFMAAEMFGKLANICGDLDARAIRQTDIFKMVTGGDVIQAERKHAHPFKFKSMAIPIFSANEPPLSSDQTDAWFSRWLVVPMETEIPEDRQDPHLIQKLTTAYELEGLLVQAVEGLRRLMARGRFELPESVRNARRAYREKLDSVQGFVAERCELADKAWTSRARLYEAYADWAKRTHRFPVSAHNFYERLRRDHGVGDRTRHGNRGLGGIRLKHLEEE